MTDEFDIGLFMKCAAAGMISKKQLREEMIEKLGI